MMYSQLVVPNPDIPCEPGWCLQYVRQAFGAPVVEPTATAGWLNADFKHADWNFPEGCFVPVWFKLEHEPAGHVALLTPSGAVYSTTNPNQYTPRKHSNMDDLFAAYAPYNPLTYLGWSEDISNVRVIEPKDVDMPSVSEVVQGLLNFEIEQSGVPGKITLGSMLAEYRVNNNRTVEETAKWVMPDVVALREVVNQLAIKQGVTIDYDAIAKAVNDDAARRLTK